MGHLLVKEAESWLIRILGNDEAQRKGAFGPMPSKQGDKAETNKAAGPTEENLDSIIIKLSSQIYVIDFYQKLGYEPVGDRYDEDGAPHQLCYKQVFLSKA